MFSFFRPLIILLLSTLFLSANAHAQSGGGNDPEPIFPVGDIQARYNSLNLDILDDGLVGDHIDLDTGSVSFTQMDVSIPGNSALPVQFGRKLSRSTFRTGMIGNWAPDIPHMSRNYTAINGQYYGKNSNRCSGQLYPPTEEVYVGGQFTYLRAEAYFTGYDIQVPGQNPGKFVQARGSNNVVYSPEFSTTEARLVSTENWYVDCISSIPSGGEGYRAHAPNGNTYEFTHQVNPFVRFLNFGGEDYSVMAETLYVTKINDVHGNWVQFQYSGANLTRIWANDGREITFTYSGGKLSTVNANGRSWTYQYASNGTLNRVNLPDGRYWTFTSNGNDLLAVDPLTSRDICFKIPIPDISIRHPSGTVVQFDFEAIQNGRKDVIFRQELYAWVNLSLSSGPNSAPPQTIFDCLGDGDARSKLPSSFWSIAVTQKRLVLPNGATHTWQRDYQEDAGSYDYPSFVTPWPPYNANLSDTKTRTVTDPEGHKTVTYINRTFGRQEGQIVKVEIIPSGQSTPVQTTEYDYINGNLIGLSLGARDHGYTGADSTRVYKTSSGVSRDGDTFTTEMAYVTNAASSTFSYGSPTQTKSYSNVNPVSQARITGTVYQHIKPKWILGLPKTVTQSGRLMSEYFYDGDGQKTQYNRYGALYAKYEYNGNGTIDEAEDALGRITKLTGWKLGKPDTIKSAFGTPDEITTLQTIDDNGWVTSTTDPNLNTTNYTHDAMGRLTQIDPPGSYFANTNITYSFPTAGGAVQTITQGGTETTITYDGLFRPILKKTDDLSSAWVSYVNTTYDALGRAVFKSQPSTSQSETAGVDTVYDALGRVISSAETVSPFATTTVEYLSDHRTRMTDAAGQETITHKDGYGGPGGGDTLRIEEPMGRNTYLNRNQWGEVESVRQTGGQGGVTRDLSHTYAYDSQRRVCRYYTPEGGATLYDYNAANEVIAYAKGQPNSGCSVPSNADRVDMVYDGLGRLEETNFFDANTPDIFRTYDDNGNLTFVNRGQLVGTVDWAYTYDALNNLKTENLQLDGRSFSLAYNYNPSGHLIEKTLPTGRTVDYTVDGLGRSQSIDTTKATQQDLLNATTYHASGAVATMDYANGFDFTQTLNARLLPQSLVTSKPGDIAMDLHYTYDVRGKVTSKDNRAQGGHNELFTYNALGQNSSEGASTWTTVYNYDSLGNMINKSNGPWEINLIHDANNRLTHRTSTGQATRLYEYDHKGNVTLRRREDCLTTHNFDYLGGGGAQWNHTVTYDACGNYIEDIHTTVGHPTQTPTSQQLHIEGFAEGESNTTTYQTMISNGAFYNVQLEASLSGNDISFRHRAWPVGDSAGTNWQDHGIVTTLPIQGESLAFTYDASDQPTSIIGTATGTYQYDGNLKRVKSVIDDEVIYNVYDASGSLAHVYKQTDGAETDYVSGPNGTLARIANDVITYLHHDHLGSAYAGTNATGQVAWREKYYAWGKPWYNVTDNDDQGGFTGHIRDNATGLIYMQARYYDTESNRFLSIDPVTFMDTGQPSYFNRYRYCSNDPINCFDPTGMSDEERNLLQKVGDAIMSIAPGGYDPSQSTGTKMQFSTDANGVMSLNEVPSTTMSEGTTQAIGQVGTALAASAGTLVPGANTSQAPAATRSATATTSKPVITQPYARPSNATTPAQRAAVQGKPCTDCGATSATQRANHTPPLVQEYYSTGTINTTRMRSTSAVTPHCPSCSNAEGGRMSAFSKAMKKEHGFD